MERKHHHDPYIQRPGLQHVPGALNTPRELNLAQVALMDHLDRLIGEDPIDAEKAGELADLYISNLPEEIRRGLKEQLEEFKTHLVAEILDLVGNNTEITKEKIRDAMMGIQLELMAHHANGIKLMAPLHEFDGQPPEKVEKHFVHSGKPWILRLERAGAYVTITLSAITSAVGGNHMAGGWIEDARKNIPFIEQLDLLKDPYVQEALSATFGVGTAAVVTFWALRKFKHELTEIAFKEDKPLTKAAATVLKNKFTGGMGSKLLGTIFVAALGYDVVSNADGAVSLFAGRFDDAKQLQVAEASIDVAKKEIQDQLASLPENVRDQVAGFAQTELSSEAGGTSASKKGGKGPMYNAKVALLTNESSGMTDLSLLSQQGGTWGTIAGQMETSVNGSGLIGDNYQGVGPHFYEVTKGITDEVGAHLTNINDLEGSLNSASGTAVNQARIEKIQTEFKEIMTLVGPDGKLKTDLGTALEKYNTALKALGEVAHANPAAYPNFEASAMQEVTLPSVNINIDNIEIKSVTFKSTYELISEFLAQGKVVEAAFWLSFALFVAMMTSYGNDIAFGGSVRETHVKDRNKIAEDKKEFQERMLQGLVTNFDVLLNGAYMSTGKSEPIHPSAIKKVILDYCQEQIAARKPHGWIAEHRRAMAQPSLTGQTEEAIDHNDELAFLAEIFNGQGAVEHIRAMRDRMLPNVNLLNETGEGLVKEITRADDTLLKQQNIDAEKDELETLEREIPTLGEKDNRKAIFEKMLKSKELLGLLTRIRQTRDKLNGAKREDIKGKLQELWQNGETAIDKNLAKEVVKISVEATHRSTREARTSLAALAGELEAYNQRSQREYAEQLINISEYPSAVRVKIQEIELKEREARAEDARVAIKDAERAAHKEWSDGTDSLKRALSNWWDDGRAETETPLNQANDLLRLLESPIILSGHINAPHATEEANFGNILEKLEYLHRTTKANGQNEEAAEIREWTRRLNAAKKHLDEFLKN